MAISELAKRPMKHWDQALMVRLIRHRYIGAERNRDRCDKRKYGEDVTDDIVAIAYTIWREHRNYWPSAIAKYAVGRYWEQHKAFYRMAPDTGKGSHGNHTADVLANIIASRKPRLRIPKWLPPQQHFILKRFVMGDTQKEIADRLGLSRQRVGQLKRQAIVAIHDDNPQPAIGRPVPKPCDIGPFCLPEKVSWSEYRKPDPIPWEVLYDNAPEYLGAFQIRSDGSLIR